MRSKNASGLGGLLYVLGILVFAIGAWPKPAVTASEEPPAPDRRARLILALGLLVGLGLNAAALLLLHGGIASTVTLLLWLASAAVLLAASTQGSALTGFPARWGAAGLPASGAARTAFGIAVALILAIAAVCRFVALERIPYGINPDEGDRAAIAIQVLRGQNDTSVFGFGWYHISMVYFRFLAVVMRAFGIGVAGARTSCAISGFLTVALVTWIGVRHFGRRAGLAAGAILATLGIALQFSRETTEATPTALLWTLSAAFFLEAARTGKAWAWASAGLAGGFSIYFYPTGRLWAPLAAFVCIGLFLGARGVTRKRIAAGTVLAAASSIAILSPFLLHAVKVPQEFTVRAHETTIFVKENPTRLRYYNPRWGLPRLLSAQLDHSLGAFDKYIDENQFWPTEKPLLPPALAVLTLVGLGAATLKVRDPRLLILAVWFWLGFVGVIVTVETPNVQRMATAVPTLALFAALVVDDVARRIEALRADSRSLRRAANGLVAAVAVLAMAREARFYFLVYAKVDRWPYPRVEGAAVAREGRSALVVSLGDQWHMVNSGWIRLLAPDARRAGLEFPGRDLPLAMKADRDLAFLVYPGQPEYLPYLKSVYPGGTVTRETHPIDVHVLDVYRVPRSSWEALQGALAAPGEGAPVRVSSLGEAPPGAATRIRWTAGLRVPRFWNYGFRVGPGPARLSIDGLEVLSVPVGARADVDVCLAMGEHFVALDGTLAKPGAGIAVEWSDKSGGGRDFAPIPGERLAPLSSPRGLYGVVEVSGQPAIERLDLAIATGGLLDELRTGGSAKARWEGTLLARQAGRHTLGIRAEGRVTVGIDGARVMDAEARGLVEQPVTLAAGPHRIEIAYASSGGPAAILFTWTTPDGITSVVPPAALAPPPGRGVGPPRAVEELGLERVNLEAPLNTVP